MCIVATPIPGYHRGGAVIDSNCATNLDDINPIGTLDALDRTLIVIWGG